MTYHKLRQIVDSDDKAKYHAEQANRYHDLMLQTGKPYYCEMSQKHFELRRQRIAEIRENLA
jgi:hypothetical protein